MSRICAHCDKELKGCSCSWRSTSDGKVVHQNCKQDYEDGLKNKERTCVICDKPFIGEPYFKNDKGAFVHFACQSKSKCNIKNK